MAASPTYYSSADMVRRLARGRKPLRDRSRRAAGDSVTSASAISALVRALLRYILPKIMWTLHTGYGKAVHYRLPTCPGQRRHPGPAGHLRRAARALEGATNQWTRLAGHSPLAVEVLKRIHRARRDRFTKRRVYQEHHVREYWIVDLENHGRSRSGRRTRNLPRVERNLADLAAGRHRRAVRAAASGAVPGRRVRAGMPVIASADDPARLRTRSCSSWWGLP